MYIMSNDERNALVGAKIEEYKAARVNMQALVDKATKMGNAAAGIASGLRHQATMDTPPTVITVGGARQLRDTDFFTKEEFDDVVDALKSGRSELAGLERDLTRYGIRPEALIIPDSN